MASTAAVALTGAWCAVPSLSPDVERAMIKQVSVAIWCQSSVRSTPLDHNALHELDTVASHGSPSDHHGLHWCVMSINSALPLAKWIEERPHTFYRSSGIHHGISHRCNAVAAKPGSARQMSSRARQGRYGS
ncbi:hypothetical protein ABWJ92_05155 [Streptomyces sp. NPDC000609]|uniref:hypothetical protein n=1 Tax=Streptomyces sp. NPDC000609 TaxID=3160957 RepID=UPI003396C264